MNPQTLSHPRGASAPLLDRFPVGTKYVIEGRAGEVRRRFVEFPDGRRIELPVIRARRPAGEAPKNTVEKFFRKGGTRRQVGR